MIHTTYYKHMKCVFHYEGEENRIVFLCLIVAHAMPVLPVADMLIARTVFTVWEG